MSGDGHTDSLDGTTKKRRTADHAARITMPTTPSEEKGPANVIYRSQRASLFQAYLDNFPNCGGSKSSCHGLIRQRSYSDSLNNRGSTEFVFRCFAAARRPVFEGSSKNHRRSYFTIFFSILGLRLVEL